jgi:hypothetical protein
MQTSVLTRQQLRASAGAPALAPRCHAARAARVPLRRAAVAGELQTVPAYKGAAVKVKKGELLKVINTHGHQARSVASLTQTAACMCWRHRRSPAALAYRARALRPYTPPMPRAAIRSVARCARRCTRSVPSPFVAPCVTC